MEYQSKYTVHLTIVQVRTMVVAGMLTLKGILIERLNGKSFATFWEVN